MDATATIPGTSSSDSSGPDSCADASSVSSGPHELRYDEVLPDGPGNFTQDDFLDYYGDVDGAARRDRATVYDSDEDARATAMAPRPARSEHACPRTPRIRACLTDAGPFLFRRISGPRSDSWAPRGDSRMRWYPSYLPSLR